MTSEERRIRELYAYHDGELGAWRRLRVRRRLARDPAARRELSAIAELGALLREEAAEAPSPDLWAGLRERLAVTPRPAVLPAVREPRWPARLPGWVGAGLVAAALATLLWIGGHPGNAPAAGSVRWLDAGGRPAMVLQDNREATIIWLLDSPDRTAGRSDRAFM